MFPPPAWNSGTIQGGIFTSSCQLQKTEIDGSCFTPKWNSQPSLGTMLLRKCRPMWTTYRLWKKYSYELITCIYLAIFLSFVFLSTYLPIYIVYIYSYIYIYDPSVVGVAKATWSPWLVLRSSAAPAATRASAAAMAWMAGSGDVAANGDAFPWEKPGRC